MALKFKCTNCGEDIIVKYLKPGEIAKCRRCSAENEVPEAAYPTDEEQVIPKAPPELPAEGPVDKAIPTEEKKPAGPGTVETGLKFKCKKCGDYIIVKDLKPRDTIKCRICGAENEVPADAIPTDEEPISERQLIEKLNAVLANAKTAIKTAGIAGMIAAALTLIGAAVVNDTWMLLDVFLVFGLSIGVLLKSRICAVSLFAYFVVAKLVLWAQVGLIVGLIWVILFAYFFYQGIRGTAAYHVITKALRRLAAESLAKIGEPAAEPTAQVPTDEAQVLVKKGITLTASGEFYRAFESFDQASKLNPALVEAWLNKALVLSYMDKYAEAAQSCEKAIELRPEDPDPWEIKGRTLHKLERYHEASAALKKFIALAPPEYAARIREAERLIEEVEPIIRAYPEAVPLDECWFCGTRAAEADATAEVKMYKDESGARRNVTVRVPRCRRCDTTDQMMTVVGYAAAVVALLAGAGGVVVASYLRGWSMGCLELAVGLVVFVVVVVILYVLGRVIRGARGMINADKYKFPAVLEMKQQGWKVGK